MNKNYSKPAVDKNEMTVFGLVNEDEFRFSYNAIYRDYIYASFKNDLGKSGYENLTNKELLSKFADFDGSNLTDNDMSNLIKELHLRQKKGENAYVTDLVKFETVDNPKGFGVHYWAKNKSKKMAIFVNNPKQLFKNYFDVVKVYNPQNIGNCVMFTAIHETQHDTQSANLIKGLSGMELSKTEVVASLLALHNVTGLIQVPYKLDYLEFDANFKAITTIMENYRNGNLKDNFNGKLLLYRDVVALYNKDKEKIKTENLRFFNLANEYLDSVRDWDIRGLLNKCNSGCIEEFKNSIDERFLELDKIRKELETYFAKNITPSIQKEIERLTKEDEKFKLINPNIATQVLEGEYNKNNCTNLNNILSEAYYNTILKKLTVDDSKNESPVF